MTRGRGAARTGIVPGPGGSQCGIGVPGGNCRRVRDGAVG
jgi:hypothetical protein